MARSKSKKANKRTGKSNARHPRRKPSPRRELQVLRKFLELVFHETGGDLRVLPGALRAPVQDAELCLLVGERPDADDWTAVLKAAAVLEAKTVPRGLFQSAVRRAEREARQLTAADAFAVMRQFRQLERELKAAMGEDLFDLTFALCSPDVSPAEALASARLILEGHGT